MQSSSIVLSGYYEKESYWNYEGAIHFINDDKYLTWLNLRGVKVNHFTCRGGLSIANTDKIVGFSTNLVSFQLLVSSFKESRSVNIPSFIRIMKTCKSLTSLQLGRFQVNSHLSVIIENCPGVQILEICGNGMDDLTDASMLRLAKGCPQLESLSFLQSLSGVFSNSFMQFIDNCPRLTSLNLSENNLTDSILCTIVESFPKLLKLNIARNKSLSDASMFTLANNCKQLQTLNIGGNQLITNANHEASMFHLVEGFSQLRSLHVSTSNFVHKLRGRFPHINFKYDSDDFIF
jgi:Leucine-rich repeat (LRR) protein